MANTNPIKSKIHPFVRNWLKDQYGMEFGRNALPLRDCDGKHEFDAVSSNSKIVAEIKTAFRMDERRQTPIWEEGIRI